MSWVRHTVVHINGLSTFTCVKEAKRHKIHSQSIHISAMFFKVITVIFESNWLNLCVSFFAFCFRSFWLHCLPSLMLCPAHLRWSITWSQFQNLKHIQRWSTAMVKPNAYIECQIFRSNQTKKQKICTLLKNKTKMIKFHYKDVRLETF